MHTTAGMPERLGPPAAGAGIVARDRLFDRLSARPVVVITATAGYGKTSLVSSWLEHARPAGAVAWLTLGPGDADAGRLSADLLTALRSPSAGALSAALGDLQAPPLLADPLAFVDSIHEALFDSDMPLTLVLDDVQHLSGSERGLEMVDHLLHWAPSTTRVILVGRTVPRLRLQRLRLEDRLELIRPRDLAFTRAETADAVSANGVAMPEAEIDRIHTATQGWPAAVKLAVLAMKAADNEGISFDLGRDRALADYLTSEVLSSVDDELRRFLLDATVDELVCPSLVDAIRGSDSAARQLEQCLADGLFLVRETGPGVEPWYRWHALFAAHMSDRRRREDPSRDRELEFKAAQWWNTVDVATAIHHALSAAAPELAGDLLATSWLELALQGRTETVTSLVKSIPAGVNAEADLHLALAFVAAQSGHLETAGLELSRARELADRRGEHSNAALEMRASVINLFLVSDKAELAEAVGHGEALLQQVREGSSTPDEATLALVELYVGMGQARLQHDPRRSLVLLRDAARSARAAGLTALELAARAEACIPSIVEGELESTRLVAVDVLAEAQAKGWGELPTVAPARGYLGWLALWQGDARSGREQLEQTLAELPPTDWGLRGVAMSNLAQAYLLEGNVSGAEAVVTSARHVAVGGRMPPWWPTLVGALDATICLARGDEQQALSHAAETGIGPDYHLASCLRARVLLLCGRPQECLVTVAGIPAEWRLPHVAVFVDALTAQALCALGRDDEAHATIERALTAAERFHLVAPFLAIGEVLTPLLTEHLERGTIHHELLPQILTRIAVSETAPANAWGEVLTDREMAIVRYLATNLSNVEIARAEFISVNTVKTHIAHIYRKLGVGNRRAALRRAGELGLF